MLCDERNKYRFGYRFSVSHGRAMLLQLEYVGFDEWVSQSVYGAGWFSFSRTSLRGSIVFGTRQLQVPVEFL